MTEGAGAPEYPGDDPEYREVQVAALGPAVRALASALKRIIDAVRKVPRVKPSPQKPGKPKKPPIPRGDTFKRPKGVPKDWVREPTKDKNGVIFIKPGSRGHTYVKIKKGAPNGSQAGQRVDNVRWQRNGQSLDKNGNPVPRKSEESHIPLEEFTFKAEIVK